MKSGEWCDIHGKVGTLVSDGIELCSFCLNPIVLTEEFRAAIDRAIVRYGKPPKADGVQFGFDLYRRDDGIVEAVPSWPQAG